MSQVVPDRIASPNLNAELRHVLRAYLALFPSEGSRYQTLLAQLAEGEDVSVRTNMRGHITTSATVLNPQQDRVLLIHHRTFHKWLPPGGHYESPGSLWNSAVRETVEETGVRGMVPHPWTVDSGVPVDIDTHAIPWHPVKREGPHVHHDFRFLATASDAEALTPDLAEVSEARWAPFSEMRESPDERVRALYDKLLGLEIFDGRVRV